MKVTGPMHSDGATGKLAGCVVFFPWKGRNVVRSLVTPKNVKSADQGDNRLVLGGVGRAAGQVKPTSLYAQQLIDLNRIPSGQTKQSYLVRSIINQFMYDATAFEAMHTAYNANTGKTAFVAGAATLGLLDFDIEYKGTSNKFDAGLMVYMLAKVAIALGFTGEPYETALASWTTTEVEALVADCAAVPEV